MTPLNTIEQSTQILPTFAAMQWKTNKLKDLRDQYAEELYQIYDKEEADTMLTMLIERFFQFSRTDLALNPDHRLSESEILRFHFAVKDLKKQKPIQYILKHVDFLNTRIMVDESVLIPRPETEEMVQHIIKQEKSDEKLKILDIGTGSGCIAISLAKNLDNAEVTGIDISENALKVASKNIFVNEVMVHFKEFNILDPDAGEDIGEFDVIVSNPPYVTEADKSQMKENVLKYEPHEALFVTDNDPLLFYMAILYFAGELLIPGGRIYLEINEKFGQEVLQTLKKNGYQLVKIHQDIHGKDRFVSGIKDSF